MRFRARRANAKSYFDEIINSILFPADDPGDEGFLRRTRSGTLRRRNRFDYSRTAKAQKIENPWETLQWLRAIRDERVRDPATREGKEFRRKFRVPFPVFEKIISMCRETNDPNFNYSEILVTNEPSIPLELKVMSVLRILAGGLTFKDGAELTQFMSETTCDTFFQKVQLMPPLLDLGMAALTI